MPFQVLEILRLGIIGLIFSLAYLPYHLIKTLIEKGQAPQNFFTLITIFMVFETLLVVLYVVVRSRKK